jgi:hypothetical protein
MLERGVRQNLTQALGGAFLGGRILSHIRTGQESKTPASQFLPVGQCHQFVEDVLQSLKPTFVIPRGAEFVLPALQIQAVRFTDFRYFAP